MFEGISNGRLIADTKVLVGEERRITLEILNHINEVERRRIYAELGYTSMFVWLTKDLGYSEPAAGRRLAAARLLKTMPDLATRIETGDVNLSTLAQAQTAIRAEEKRLGEKMPLHVKSEVVASIDSCSYRESEKNLASMFPEISIHRDVVRVVNENEIRAHVTFTSAQMEKIKRAGELLSHKIADGNLAAILEAALDELIARKDPLVKVVKPRKKQDQRSVLSDADESISSGIADASMDLAPDGDNQNITRSFADAVVPQDVGGIEPTPRQSVSDFRKVNDDAIPPSRRNAVFRRDGGCCIYKDGLNGAVCGSRQRVQVDHVIPRARGGSNEIENLRLLCRTHNLMMAERWFGRTKMEGYRSR